MAKKRRFTSVGDAVAFLAEDDAVRKEVEEEVGNSRIVDNLLQLRVGKGVTQRELAERMGCDPSKISRMEAGNDLQLKMGDVLQYLSALGVTMSLFFEDTSLPAAGQIKPHVYAIQEQLGKLVEIARQVDGDEEIITKIHAFCGDVLFDFLKKFEGEYKQLCVASGRVTTSLKGVFPYNALSAGKSESVDADCNAASCC